MQLWRYVITTDEGKAPNYEPPFVTLAICKPTIRKHAVEGDLVLAFAGKPLSRPAAAVVWAGIVSEKLTFAQYWADPRFQGKKPGASSRPDNIYEPRISGLKQVRNLSHGECDKASDIRGTYVLVFETSFKLAYTAEPCPPEYRMPLNSRRGERKTELSDNQFTSLVAWLNSQPTQDSPQNPRIGPCTTFRTPRRKSSPVGC